MLFSSFHAAQRAQSILLDFRLLKIYCEKYEGGTLAEGV